MKNYDILQKDFFDISILYIYIYIYHISKYIIKNSHNVNDICIFGEMKKTLVLKSIKWWRHNKHRVKEYYEFRDLGWFYNVFDGQYIVLCGAIKHHFYVLNLLHYTFCRWIHQVWKTWQAFKFTILKIFLSRDKVSFIIMLK